MRLRRGAWSLDRQQQPELGPSIHDFLLRHRERIGLDSAGQTLPDEPLLGPFPGGIRWAPGALDGMTGRHIAPPADPLLAEEVRDSILVLTVDDPPSDALTHLYRITAEPRAIAYVDQVLRAVLAEPGIDLDRVREIGRWLATRGDRREPVKLGIALLGATISPDALDVFLTLGRHDEFTLYCAVAIRATFKTPDRVLWEVGRHVTGWGRVEIVYRLYDSQLPDVRAWLLRDGFRNEVDLGYTAALVAIGCNLARALEIDEDEALVDAATEMIGAMSETGGPGLTLASYPDAARAIDQILQRLAVRPPVISRGAALLALREWLTTDESEPEDPALAAAARRAFADRVNKVLYQPAWVDAVNEAITSDDPDRREQAALLRAALNIV
ncbi:MAG TPA: hypothetical protein VGX28_02225 [Frankiaceae bacterium]|nr:hypothetical protein [Frankiaceae bacterium]